MTPTNEGLSARLRAMTWACDDCPPIGYPTDKTRCLPCPRRLLEPRPQSEWSEEDGDVLWWHYPIQEPPYAGSMLDVQFDAEWHRWWTPLPDGNAMEAAIRAKAGDL